MNKKISIFLSLLLLLFNASYGKSIKLNKKELSAPYSDVVSDYLYNIQRDQTTKSIQLFDFPEFEFSDLNELSVSIDSFETLVFKRSFFSEKEKTFTWIAEYFKI